MVQTQREREDKFDIDLAYALPDLADLAPAGGRVESATLRLRSTYYDTPDHVLLGQRMTLRRREGDADTGWHLKVPDGKARTELRLGLEAGEAGATVPAELVELVSGVVGGAELGPIAILRVERRLQRILDAAGVMIMEVADDLVDAAVLGEAAVASRWRELEVELGTGGERLLARVGKRLVKARARRSAYTSKLGRALASSNKEPAHRHHDARPVGAADLVVRYLADQYHALGAGDVSLRRGLDPIHPTRVATRRLRSTLRVFTELFEPAAALELDGELAWYAGVLGEVRDRQVQRDRFAAALAALPAELVLGPVAAHIEQELLGEQLHHRQQLAAALDGERYRALLATTAAWALDPPFTAAAAGSPQVVATLATKAGRKASARLVATQDELALHRARKAAKRARYAAELATPALGAKRAKAAIARQKAVQKTLGDHQDSMVAAQLLRRLGAAAGTTPGQNGFTYGLLYAQELESARRSRAAAATLAPPAG